MRVLQPVPVQVLLPESWRVRPLLAPWQELRGRLPPVGVKLRLSLASAVS